MSCVSWGSGGCSEAYEGADLSDVADGSARWSAYNQSYSGSFGFCRSAMRSRYLPA
ncbi:MAG: hypothetical protein ACR2LE_09135 [Nocardioidaceae bacterium]